MVLRRVDPDRVERVDRLLRALRVEGVRPEPVRVEGVAPTCPEVVFEAVLGPAMPHASQ